MPVESVPRWAWVIWIAGSAALALAFGNARDVALHLLILDVMLLFIVLLQITRRRAHAVLAAVGDLADRR
jgi:hypothetical protein